MLRNPLFLFKAANDDNRRLIVSTCYFLKVAGVALDVMQRWLEQLLHDANICGFRETEPPLHYT